MLSWVIAVAIDLLDIVERGRGEGHRVLMGIAELVEIGLLLAVGRDQLVHGLSGIAEHLLRRIGVGDVGPDWTARAASDRWP